MSMPRRLFALLLLCAAAARGDPIAYVSNEKSGSVSLIDVAADKVVGELRAGSKPRGIALSPDGARLYLSDRAANALIVVDLGRREVERQIPLGQSPEGIGLSRDGRWLAARSESSPRCARRPTRAARRPAARPVSTTAKITDGVRYFAYSAWPFGEPQA